jgi:hypothetical protein
VRLDINGKKKFLMAIVKSIKDFGIETLSAFLYLFFTRAGNEFMRPLEEHEVKFLRKPCPVHSRDKNQCSDK